MGGSPTDRGARFRTLWRTPRALAVVTVLLVGVGWASPASAGSINVNCSSQSLQTKINAAPSGATLNVKGTCRGPFKIKKSITLRGAPTATLDGQDLGTTLTITGTPTVHLTRLVITRGLNSAGSYSAGGGILHAGGALSLRSVTVLDNAAVGVDAAGGGIYSSGGSLRLVSASVVQNRADAASAGPGITSADVTTVDIDCIFYASNGSAQSQSFANAVPVSGVSLPSPLNPSHWNSISSGGASK